MEARVAERLVALETRDIDVPVSPSGTLAPLYFRVLRAPPTSLRVELWELGKSEGVRNVSATGSPALEARRVALVAAELARTFRRRRLAEIQAAEREAARERSDAGEGDGFPIHARLGWAGGARVLALSSGVLGGPLAEASLRFHSGPRLALDAGWLAGSGTVRDVDRSLRLLEVGLTASCAAPLSRGAALDVGLFAKVGSLRLGGRDTTGPEDTWSARSGLSARLELGLSRALSLAAGPEASVLLRRVDGDLGGIVVGGTVTLVAVP
ncbi:MAG TPA: hypothetical protein VHE30_27630 [Polyangiaceae bacterium]|nr:hypothetical protein [Polyangiaceae bacterium]